MVAVDQGERGVRGLGDGRGGCGQNLLYERRIQRRKKDTSIPDPGMSDMWPKVV